MARQLADILTSITLQSDAEALQNIRNIRHRRNIERPAAKKRRKQEAVKKARSNSGQAKRKMRTLIDKLSPEQRAELLNKLKD